MGPLYVGRGGIERGGKGERGARDFPDSFPDNFNHLNCSASKYTELWQWKQSGKYLLNHFQPRTRLATISTVSSRRVAAGSYSWQLRSIELVT